VRARDCIDQRDLPLNSPCNYNTTAGTVNACIIDTGIKTGHPELGGRAVKGFEASAITVGAITSTDARASYSSYGKCLGLFAPGLSITSAWHTSNSALNTMGSPSMATPHVAGGGRPLSGEQPSASSATVRNAATNARPHPPGVFFMAQVVVAPTADSAASFYP
jgi:subtilisin family serine protease